MVQDIQTSVPVGQPYNPTFRLTACVNVTPAFLQVPAVHISLLSMVPQVSSSKHILWKTEQHKHILWKREQHKHILWKTEQHRCLCKTEQHRCLCTHTQKAYKDLIKSNGSFLLLSAHHLPSSFSLQQQDTCTHASTHTHLLTHTHARKHTATVKWG